MSMKTKSVLSVSKYCEECIRYKLKGCGGCEGKPPLPEFVYYFGCKKSGTHLKHGLNFCKLYECDVRLYVFADGSGKAETIHTVRKRQAKRDEEISNEETFDDFESGAGLSEEDFADLGL